MSYDLSKISTEGQEGRSVSPFIGYGTGQVLRINEIELKYSKNTGSPKAVLHMESKPIEDPNFKPVDGAKGKVGRISCGVYMKEESAKQEFLRKMKLVAFALDLKEEIEKISGKSFPEVVEKMAGVICGSDKWAKYTILAEEYPKPDGQVGVSYFLPRYNFVEGLDVENSTLTKFDKNNKFHYKKLPDAVQEGTDSATDDLPF